MAEGINKYGATARQVRRAYAAPETRVKVKTDRAKSLAIAREKRDVNQGLNEREIKTLYALEDARRDRKTEQVNIVDDGGNVIFTKSGTKKRVSLLNSEAAKMRDKILTHNHPTQDYFGNGIAKRIGTSLSGADIKAAIDNNAKEIRASAQGYIFSMKRPKGGWNADPNAVLRDYNRMFKDSVRESHQYIKGASGKGREVWDNRQGRANVATSNRIMRDLAKKYGFIYTRRKL